MFIFDFIGGILGFVVNLIAAILNTVFFFL